MTGHLSYIPGLITAYRRGLATDHVHLGYWPDRQRLDFPAAQTAMAQLHLDALCLSDGMTVVDVGCGIGGSLRLVNQTQRDCRLIGVNIDPAQLAICAETVPRNGNLLRWLEADAGDTGVSSESADRVLSLEAMFHFPSRAAFFAEVARILRPGGVLVCSDILIGEPETSLEKAWYDLMLAGYAPWPEAQATLADHKDGARAAGLWMKQSRDIAAATDKTWDHIVSSKAAPLSSPHAAMKALHRAGRLRYQLSAFQKPAG